MKTIERIGTVLIELIIAIFSLLLVASSIGWFHYFLMGIHMYDSDSSPDEEFFLHAMSFRLGFLSVALLPASLLLMIRERTEDLLRFVPIVIGGMSGSLAFAILLYFRSGEVVFSTLLTIACAGCTLGAINLIFRIGFWFKRSRASVA